MTLKLVIQNVSGIEDLPIFSLWEHWLQTALQNHTSTAEITLRIVNEAESADINWRSRQKSGPTNILSFPFTDMPGISDNGIIGDIVICAPLALQEACHRNIDSTEHFAHLFVHGLLHLLGYDHHNQPDTLIMESLEVKILQQLAYGNPYAES